MSVLAGAAKCDTCGKQTINYYASDWYCLEGELNKPAGDGVCRVGGVGNVTHYCSKKCLLG